MADIVFVDTEVSPQDNKVKDIGAVRTKLKVHSVNGSEFHGAGLQSFESFASGAVFLCGHNLIDFDIKYLNGNIEKTGIKSFIDTLYLSPILFPRKPYHRLVKDEKLLVDELNNPLNDSKKCMELYIDEVDKYYSIDEPLRKIYYALLFDKIGYMGFFKSIGVTYKPENVLELIKGFFSESICTSADIGDLISKYPIELAYSLAAISANDKDSIIPSWVDYRYPNVKYVHKILRGNPCENQNCKYCSTKFNLKGRLKEFFGYDDFRSYNGQKLQENATSAAVHGKSLLAVFPTGGGKSLTFQLPALIDSETVKGLTVVISPLQSLMKDQVDNLDKKGISDAVTINGLLNPIEKKEAIDRIESGLASILYIAPESLRSKTIERLLLSRNVTRFVIDEAHCFSSWGQDFRVDYLYIGDFIAKLQKEKKQTIQVSCFTATAKQKVISDIREYFKQKLDIELELYTTDAARKNLRYEVIYRDNKRDKYQTLRSLIEQKNCPTIVYTSRTKRTEELADKLVVDGFDACAFHGKMSQDEKIINQNDFMSGRKQIIVATSAFGMGVDKPDVGLVIHYDISDSLENYVQEAGRAGRDESINADCYVLYNESDLDSHFVLLNQTRLSINEVQQIWRGIKNLSQNRERLVSSAYEIAKYAGWNVEVENDYETKVKTAISALEIAGYIKRENNSPRVYADRLKVRNQNEARLIIENSGLFDDTQKDIASRLVQILISEKSRGEKNINNIESLTDRLGIEKARTIEMISLLKQSGIMADNKEMAVFINEFDLGKNTVNKNVAKYLRLEMFLLDHLEQSGLRLNYKELNEEAADENIKSTVSMLKEIIHFWTIKGYIKKPEGERDKSVLICPLLSIAEIEKKIYLRTEICDFVTDYFLQKAMVIHESLINEDKRIIKLDFSAIELKDAFDNRISLFDYGEVKVSDIEEALLYLSKTKTYRMEGGFLIIYNAMVINRVEMDNRIQYKKEDYKSFDEFYRNKTQQIHIVGEYANMIVKDYDAAIVFVNDYFQMDYNLFLKKYFEGNRMQEIDRNISPEKYHELFENLTDRQAEIINDDNSQYIVVAAGPGSGKTMVLVHKLASLLLLEDVKHDQLLMLTFSRAAAMEFQKRLFDLVGKAAYFVEIKTFHSYAFDILGKIGSIEKSKNIISTAAMAIKNGDVEVEKITKTVLVLDEAQDINADEYELITAIKNSNDNMRIIAVGDDDQNIFAFRGSNSKYMRKFLEYDNSKLYELVENFRSGDKIVEVCNLYARLLSGRLKLNDIKSVKNVDSNVIVVRTKSYVEQEVMKIFDRYYKLGESTAILTTTNDQAYFIYSLLNKKGYKPRLIQSADSFSLYNLEEFRWFAKRLDKDGVSVIDNAEWDEAVQNLKKKFDRSANLDNVLYTLDVFKKSNNKLYYSDIISFLKECEFNDFYKCDKDEIIVSTIHKSKGHEYDSVFLVLSNIEKINDEDRRRIYVGMTRAKRNLYIIQNGNCFGNDIENVSKLGVLFYKDETAYEEPDEIMLNMTHRDIWLGYKSKVLNKDKVTIQSGDKLDVKRDEHISFSVVSRENADIVTNASESFRNRINQYVEKGYDIYKSNVNYVVYWENENKEEQKIVLPRIILRKKKK